MSASRLAPAGVGSAPPGLLGGQFAARRERVEAGDRERRGEAGGHRQAHGAQPDDGDVDALSWSCDRAPYC